MKNLYIFLVILMVGFIQTAIAQTDLTLNWVKNLQNDQPLGGYASGSVIKVDATGNSYVAGGFSGTADFDPSTGTANLTSTGDNCAFFAKYDTTGAYLYAKSIEVKMITVFSSNAYVNITSIAFDHNGNIYITGGFEGIADFDPSFSVANYASVGGSDFFLAKYDALGNYVYAKIFGGISYDNSPSLMIDASDNIFLVGLLRDTIDFDPSANLANLTASGASDIFLAKYDTLGNYIFAKSIGGTGTDFSGSSTIDGSGNIYFTGGFESTVDFDTSPGTAFLTSSGGRDIFLAKYDSSGNYVYALSLESSDSDSVASLAIDIIGNLYLSGYLYGTVDFDPSTGTANLTSSGGSDIFLVKYNSSGNYIFAQSIGGISNEYISKIAIDGSSNIYLTGGFEGTVDFDPTVATANLTSNGGRDIFIAKYDTFGNYIYANSMGGTRYDLSASIDVAANGTTYITGVFQETVDFDPSASTANLTTPPGDINIQNGYFCQYDSSGNYVWAKSLGGYSNIALGDYSTDIVRDASGNIYIIGEFQGTVDFDPSAGIANLTSTGLNDIFLAKYDALGNYVFAKNMGGVNYDGGSSIAIDTNGNIYLTGYFIGTADFDPSVSTANLTTTEQDDIFLAKYDSFGNYVFAKSLIGNDSGFTNSIAVDSNGNIYLIGVFWGTVDFDPAAATANLTSAGDSGVFIAKYDVSGNYIFAKSIDGPGSENSPSFVMDNDGNGYITGHFQGTVDFDPSFSTANLISSGGYDLFFAKYDSSGNYINAKAIGGSGATTVGTSIAIDTLGNICLSGYFNGTVDFDPSTGSANLSSTYSSMFLAKYDVLGNYIFANNFGGATFINANSYSVATDNNNSIYLLGTFYNTVDFDPSANTANLINLEHQSIFLAKYDSLGGYVYAKSIDGTSDILAQSFAVDNNGNIYLTGQFSKTADFNPSNNTTELTALNGSDIFIARYTETLPNVITTGNVIPSICAGSSLNVAFTATDTYNEGNIFTAQLSDSSGDFTSPLNIGTLSGTESGSINVTIPANTSSGTEYRIRVVSSNPVIIGSDNGSNITVTSLITYYRDSDSDGYGNVANTTLACSLPTGYVTNSTDCNDSNINIHPGAVEICANGIDDNCNGVTDEACPPTLSINDMSVNEGGLASINVSLSSPSVLPIKFNYTTKDGTATSKGKTKDYTTKNGTLTIPAGSISANISISTAIDNLLEATEYFDVVLSKVTNATLFDNSGRVFITNGTAISKEMNSEFVVNIYPNPSGHQFTLEISGFDTVNEKVEITVHNIYGRQVYNTNGVKNIYIFGENFPSGMYIVDVRRGDENVVFKVIKN